LHRNNEGTPPDGKGFKTITMATFLEEVMQDERKGDDDNAAPWYVVVPSFAVNRIRVHWFGHICSCTQLVGFLPTTTLTIHDHRSFCGHRFASSRHAMYIQHSCPNQRKHAPLHRRYKHHILEKVLTGDNNPLAI
jgi:hypothetical protein